LLRRALDFKRLHQVAIGSYFAGYLAVGLPLALAGSGVWALVAAALVQAGAASAAYAFIGRAELGWSIRPSDQGVLPFGTRVILANLTSWSIMNVDSIAIGRSLGIVDLGYYNRAMGLVSAPIGALVSGLQSVLFSSGSRLQLEPDKLLRLFVASSAAVALLTLPLFGSVALVAETVTVAFYGPAWRAAAEVMAPLALVMVMNAMLCLVGPLLMSMDLVARELRVQLIVLAVMAPALYLAAQDSLRLVGWVMLGVSSLRWALLTHALLAAVAGSWVGLLGNLKWPLVLGCTVALPVFVVDRVSSALIPSHTVRLMLLVAIGVLATAFGLRALGPRLMRGELGLLVRDQVTRRPTFRRLLNLQSW
jgi:O-antigen/teichoic acid export membrane protein